MVAALFLYPLGFSLVVGLHASRTAASRCSISRRRSSSIPTDILFTLFIVVVSTLLTALFSIAIAGILTLGENAVARSRPCAGLYRWPLFIPFIVAAQCMRTFLAKNGLMNNTLRRRSA